MNFAQKQTFFNYNNQYGPKVSFTPHKGVEIRQEIS